MSEIVNIISNANPVVAAAIIVLGISVAMLKKSVDNRLNTLEKRITEYDKMHIEATMTQITTDLAWIKSKLIELTKK